MTTLLLLLLIASPSAFAAKLSLSCAREEAVRLTEGETQARALHWEETIQREFSRATEDFANLRADALGGRTLAEILGELWERGDEHARSLIDYGYRIERDAQGRARMVSPSSWRAIFDAYESRQRELLARGAITGSSRMDPALIFVRKAAPPDDPSRYVLIVPGRDPWPDPAEYSFNLDPTSTDQLSLELWGQGMAGGRMPFAIRGRAILEHDVTHALEMQAYPEIQGAVRDSYAEILDVPVARRPGAVSVQAEPRHSNQALWFTRIFLANEFVALPNPAEAARIHAMMPELFAARPPAGAAEHMAELHRLPAPDFQARVEALASRGEALLVFHGGGIRDGINFDRRMTTGIVEASLSQLAEHLLGGHPGARFPYSNSRVAVESLRGQQRELAALSRMRYHWAEYAPGPHGAMYQLLSQRTEAQRTQILDMLLLSVVSRFEMGIATGLREGITPGQVIRALGARRVEKGSAVTRFFASFGLPYWLTTEALRAGDGSR